LIPGFELGFKLVAGQGFNIGQHATSINGGNAETKPRYYNIA
jgi:hypothetical protein